MKRILRKVLCFVGSHKNYYFDDNMTINGIRFTYKRCLDCGSDGVTYSILLSNSMFHTVLENRRQVFHFYQTKESTRRILIEKMQYHAELVN